MQARDYLKAIVRRWPVVAVLFVLGLALGYVGSKPAASPSAGPAAPTTYSASALLDLPPNTADPTGLSLDAMALVATSGPVASMTSSALHGSLTTSQVTAQVQAAAQDSLSVIQVTASGSTPASASGLANTYSNELIAYLNQRLVASWKQSLAADQAQLKVLVKVEASLHQQPSSSLVQAELSQEQGQYVTDDLAYQQLQASGPQRTSLSLLQPASPSAATVAAAAAAAPASSGHSLIPKSRKKLMLFAGLAGLLVGIAIALVRDRLDDSVRTREQAEEAFGLPVLGVLPALQQGRRGLVLLATPFSAAAEAYRMLQTAMSPPPGSGEHELGTRTIMVTSAYEVRDKELVIANLAASFSESGASVALVAMDSYDGSLPALVSPRRAGRSGRRLDGAPDPGAGPLDTVIEGVSLFLDGLRPGIGSGRNAQHEQIVAAARRRAEIVLVDTPPALLTHDAGKFAAFADSVVLLCPVGEVKRAEAGRAAESLRRVGAHLGGVVLVGSASRARRVLRLLQGGSAPRRPPAGVSVPAAGAPGVASVTVPGAAPAGGSELAIPAALAAWDSPEA